MGVSTMNKIIQERQPCPLEDCNSSDAYFEYEDGGWCYSCGRGTASNRKYTDCVYVEEEFRGVDDEVSKALGFFSLASPEDPETVLYREYRYPEGVKYRNVKSKKFWVTGKICGLGGKELWNAGSSKVICVVEGEEDAAAFHTMCDLPVVWLTSASIGTKHRKEIHEYLDAFTKVILCFENDDAGKHAKSILGAMLGNKVHEASLTKYKDASDYLQYGARDDFFYAVLNAKKYTADFVFNSDADFERILNDVNTTAVISTPFEKLNSLINGLPLGHIVLITGQEGLGKTEILRAFEYNNLKNYSQYPASITHHEESKADNLKGLASYNLGINTKNKDNNVSLQTILDQIKELNKDDNLFLTDIGEGNNVGEIMDRFKYLVTVCGVKVIYVDPINQFTPPDEGEQNVTKFLDNLAQRMAKFVVDYQVCCVWTAHVNDEGKTRDSRMISKSASIRIDIERDHMSASDETKNTTTLWVSKNRPFGKTGHGGQLFFDSESFTLIEKEEKEMPF